MPLLGTFSVSVQPRERASASVALPRFAEPPVVEVAISVQFETLAGLQLVDFGLFWDRIRTRYPRTQQHPPIPPVVELFGGQTQRLQFRVEPAFTPGRCWYLSSDGHRLLQLQPDRFILNWQKQDSGTPYPSYDTLRDEFRHELESFLAFAAERQLGAFEPTQCELIYVNHLVAGQEWATVSDLPDVLRPWTGTARGMSLPDVEDVRLAWQYRFGGEGRPLGRLHVQLHSAVRTVDARQVFALQLTARGAPGEGGVDGVLAFTDKAHEWVVNGFADITTDRMHQRWGRQQ